MTFINPSRRSIPDASTTLLLALAVLLTLAAIAAHANALIELVRRWFVEEEYGHGFFIPAITLWLLWSRRDALRASIGRANFSGPALIVLALGMHFLGELSAFFLLSQIAFVLALLGVVLSIGGWSLFYVCATPIIFLALAFPLPYFLQSVLTWHLQIISSELGASVIRLFQIPVFLDGNIIDLGNYQLQVVEACSGLRYLYPLMSLSFLAAYFFNAPLWKRAVVFLSAVPITIAMNSFRIGLTGVLVNRWGIQMAEGAMHFFEGWIIFLSCALLIAAEIWLLSRIGETSRRQGPIFAVPEVAPSTTRGAFRGAFTVRAHMKSIGLSLALLVVGGLTIFHLTSRPEVVPERSRFVEFPNQIGQWTGRVSQLEPRVEHTLGLDDYLLADYRKLGGRPINLYVAYYGSQRQGNSPHSPIVCMPGGGWRIIDFQRANFSDSTTGSSFPINRAVIAKGALKQLVYYWFVQRGRKVANEYLSKLYLLQDAVFMNRTDGALVRVTTQIAQNETEADAEARLKAMVRDVDPILSRFLPSQAIVASAD